MNVYIYGYFSQDTPTNLKFQIIEKKSLIMAHFFNWGEKNYYIGNSCYISFMIFY